MHYEWSSLFLNIRAKLQCHDYFKLDLDSNIGLLVFGFFYSLIFFDHCLLLSY